MKISDCIGRIRSDENVITVYAETKVKLILTTDAGDAEIVLNKNDLSELIGMLEDA